MKTLVQTRVDDEIKASAEKILSRYGLDMPTMLRMAIYATINNQGISFLLGSSEDATDAKAADEAYKNYKESGRESIGIDEIAKNLGVKL
jgi:addiction module RelB/DinJ family antitoxin